MLKKCSNYSVNPSLSLSVKHKNGMTGLRLGQRHAISPISVKINEKTQ